MVLKAFYCENGIPIQFRNDVNMNSALGEFSSTTRLGNFRRPQDFDSVICERHFSLLNRLGTPPKMLRRGPFIRFDSDLTSKVKIGEKNV